MFLLRLWLAMESGEYDTSKSSEDQSKNVQEDELANSNIDTNEVDIIFQMEEEAKVRAAKQVAAMLRRPELIEKVKRLIFVSVFWFLILGSITHR